MAHITLSQLRTVLGRIVAWATSKFAARNATSGKLEYADMPVVVLASMGAELDGTETDLPMSVGDTYFLPAGQGVGARIMYRRDSGNPVKISDPVGNILYCNAHTGLLYRWDLTTNRMVNVGGDGDGLRKVYTSGSDFSSLDALHSAETAGVYQVIDQPSQRIIGTLVVSCDDNHGTTPHFVTQWLFSNLALSGDDGFSGSLRGHYMEGKAHIVHRFYNASTPVSENNDIPLNTWSEWKVYGLTLDELYVLFGSKQDALVAGNGIAIAQDGKTVSVAEAIRTGAGKGATAVQSVSVNDVPVPADQNGNVNIQVQSGGETVVINTEGVNIVDSHTNNSVLVAGSARQVKMLYDNIMQIFNNLGNYAFPDGKPQLNWIGTHIQYTLSYGTLSGCQADVTAGQVNEGALRITLTPTTASMVFTSVLVNNVAHSWTPSGESDGRIYLDIVVNDDITVSATATAGYQVSLGSGSSNVTLYGSSALPNETYHGRIDADANYDRPARINATMNGNAVDFTASGNSYTQATGEIVIANVTGPIVITAQAVQQAHLTLTLPTDANIICKHGTEVLGATVTVYSGMMPYSVTIEPAEGCHFTSVPSVGGTALPNSGEIYTLNIPAGSTNDIAVTASAVSANAMFRGVRYGEVSSGNYLYVGDYENWAISPMIDVTGIDTLKFLISGASAAPAGIIMFNEDKKSTGRVTAGESEKTATRGTGGFIQGTKYVRLQMPVSLLTDANADAYITDGNGNDLWRLSDYSGGVASAADFLASEYNPYPKQTFGTKDAWIGWAMAFANKDWNGTTNQNGSSSFWTDHFSMVCKPHFDQTPLTFGVSPVYDTESTPSTVKIECNSPFNVADGQKGAAFMATEDYLWGWWLQNGSERTINKFSSLPSGKSIRHVRMVFRLGDNNAYLAGNGTALFINGVEKWRIKATQSSE